jgi:hypothetical protein
VSTDRLAKAGEANEPDASALNKANEALLESAPLILVPTSSAAWPHAIIPTSDVAHRDPRQEAVSLSAEALPNPPARNPTRGRDTETAAIPSTAAMPTIPIRNPLR